MFKITFIGAGSTVFAKNVLGDIMLTEELKDYEIALFDIDKNRLEESYLVINNISKKYNPNVVINKYLDRVEALTGAKYVVNAIQVGGYKPCTVIDFDIPKKYGLKQTIGDTLGIGGIFRGLRTIPVMQSIAEDMEKVCPNALLINYTNPMAILSGYMQRYTNIKTVGLCHSVQVCVKNLLDTLDMGEFNDSCKSVIAGINHQAWLLEIKDKDGNDLYPEIKRRSLSGEYKEKMKWDLVRHEMMHRFGYYNTESSEHTSEYNPYFIKDKYPERIERFNIPIDEYLRRCVNQINDWEKQRDMLIKNENIEHIKSKEFAAPLIRAMELDVPYRLHGNVLNNNYILNLPTDACVEVACLVDRNGISPAFVGKLPQQLAALNRTNINVQLMTIEAAVTKKKDAIYQAAYLDPHTSSELSMDEIKDMCDEMIEAYGEFLPKYN